MSGSYSTNGYFLAILLVIFLVGGTSCEKRDDTLVPRARGKDVVDAVLRKLAKSEIFPEDHNFLLRLAYVESRFGENDDPFRSHYYGGIWQVDESIFRITESNRSTLSNHTTPTHLEFTLALVQTRLAINWNFVKWRDLLSPLYSGLGAALYFASVAEPIPQTIQGQAAYWKKWYRPHGDVQKFVDDSIQLANQTRCRGKMDLCIVLDSSGSIGAHNYQTAKDFTANLIESFTLDQTRIGMLIYGSTVQDIFEMNTNLPIPAMANLAKSAIYLSSGTATDLGILRAVEMFKNVAHIEGTPRVMAVLTDGVSNDPALTTKAVQSIKNNNIKSISVGIGSGINQAELLMIALGDSQRVFSVSNFFSLADFISQLTSVTCDVPQEPVINGTYNDTVEMGENRIYKMTLPPVGITISLKPIAGKLEGFWSLSEEVPSSAVHDGKLGKSTYIPAPVIAPEKKTRTKRQTAWYPTNVTETETEAETETGATLYFSIVGMGEGQNNYTIATTEGGSGTVSLASALLVAGLCMHFLLKF